MPQQIERNANHALGDLLRRMLPKYDVRYENTQQIVNRPGLQPDVLITAPGRSPVVVEAEFMPAYTAEVDAKGRLGLEVVGTARRIDAAIALRYPDAIKDAYELSPAISNAQLSYCVLYSDGTRFPDSGWLDGSVEDLADLIRLVSVPQSAVEEAADALKDGIDRAANILNQFAQSRPEVVASIAGLLGMSDVIQTYRMAGAIVANAMVFHERLVGMHGVRPLSQLCSPRAKSPKADILDAWTEVLKINYWPIFAIARDIVEQLPTAEASQILINLEYTVGEVAKTGADKANDLTGRIFQKLIADRKYLATFYTLPSSAALLARLAVAKMDVDWSDPEAISALRIGDFACGTGALLSAVYEQIATRHERAGGDLEVLHPVMMEEVLYGCDVMPSAIHITGSTLSGAQPNVGFGNTRLYPFAYGRQEDRTVHIGSLELLVSQSARTLFNTSNPAMRTGSIGEETAAQIIADVPHETFDLVIMNPPFTSNTKHYDADDGVLNAAFAAYNSSEREQSQMANRLKRLAQASTYHGHAGLASAFATLAHRKVRPGGLVAFVLPFTAINGSSWAKFRELIAASYTDTSIVSIAANGKDMSFSSDTGIAECLLIARKTKDSNGVPIQPRAHFTSLRHRPHDLTEAAAMATAMANCGHIRSIEDGPYGGTQLIVGDEVVGESLDAPGDDYETGWGAGRIADATVAQVAHLLTRGKLWLPAEAKELDIPMAELHEIGRLGVHDSMLTLKTHNGPFTKVSYSPTATYPSLWNHNAKAENRMVCSPDMALQVKPGMEHRAAELWTTSSRAHLNRDFTFGSQALAVAYTEQESAGGRVWPNVILRSKLFDHAFTVWGNSSLGLLSYWWHSSRQQSSKASMTRLSAPSLPVLDLRTLTDDQLSTAQEIFDDFRHRDLMPAYLADADPNRALLDRRVICDLLGFDQDTYRAVRRLSAKWCAEPSVHGAKKRPPGFELVI